MPQATAGLGVEPRGSARRVSFTLFSAMGRPLRTRRGPRDRPRGNVKELAAEAAEKAVGPREGAAFEHPLSLFLWMRAHAGSLAPSPGTTKPRLSLPVPARAA